MSAMAFPVRRGAVERSSSLAQRPSAPAANRSRRLPRPVCAPLAYCRLTSTPYYMKDTPAGSHESEPIGIIISRGARTDQPPVFRAFVWGQAPEAPPVPKDCKVA